MAGFSFGFGFGFGCSFDLVGSSHLKATYEMPGYGFGFCFGCSFDCAAP